VAFLFLEMPPDLVDVNVHPTKAEVRFREGQGLYSLVLHAIRGRLNAANLTPRLQVPSSLAVPRAPEPTAGVYRPAFDTHNQGQTTPTFELEGPDAEARILDFGRPLPDPAPRSPDLPAPPPPPMTLLLPPTGDLKAIQLYNAYLVIETPEGMLVIDQHALHERVLFEHLKSRIRQGTLETQRLLIPEPVELSAEQAARTLEQRAALAELGLEVEDFGGGTVLVSSYPSILGHRAPAAILQAVVDHLLAQERPPTREQLLNGLLSLMACHAAVRAGDRLTPEQMAALVAQRHLADDIHHCPHGRPTTLLFSRHELERQFRRV
jgi:DNA mismatch repair protein MutL